MYIVYWVGYWQCWHIQWKLLGWFLISLHACIDSVDMWHTLDLAKVAFLHIPVFGGKVFLIIPISYQIAHLHNWPTWPRLTLWSLPTSTLDDTITHYLAVLEGILRLFPQFALKFHWLKTCFGCINSVDIEITIKLSYLLCICHAQTSLLDDCAGGTQGVQLLDR